MVKSATADSAGSIAQRLAAKARWSGLFSVRAGKWTEDQHPLPEGWQTVNGTAGLSRNGKTRGREPIDPTPIRASRGADLAGSFPGWWPSAGDGNGAMWPATEDFWRTAFRFFRFGASLQRWEHFQPRGRL